MNPKATIPRTLLKEVGAVTSLLGMALLPKCPVCIGLYMGFFSSFGLGTLITSPWGAVSLGLFSLLFLALLLKPGSGRFNTLAFLAASTALVVVLLERMFFSNPLLKWSGIVCVALCVIVEKIRSRRPLCQPVSIVIKRKSSVIYDAPNP